ncbi:hypothetical protein [Sporofaciens musculi]|jgi:hypothetical protein|uniref:hypothetical protein n=1 Tax=Sporofaciens musculi TaxID=2681861 RepID=UPI0025A2FA76|nr:hypothetical protein [Sporofaciens musculi]
MGKSLEERLITFTVEFTKTVICNYNIEIRHSEGLVMHYGKKALSMAEIAKKLINSGWSMEMCVRHYLRNLKEDQRLDVSECSATSGTRGCVAWTTGVAGMYDDETDSINACMDKIAGKYKLCCEPSPSGCGFCIYNSYLNTDRVISILQNYQVCDAAQCPIVVVGPDGTKKSMLRIYAYGGCIGRIATRKNDCNRLSNDRGYAKYLRNLSEDRDGVYLKHMEYTYAEEFEKTKGDNFCEKLSNKLQEIQDGQDGRLLFDISPLYVELIVKAAEKRFTKESGDLGEMAIRTAIARQHMKKDASSLWCIIDMEYAVTISISPLKRQFKPDIVVYDKDNGFGLIELKYANDSKENCVKHYEDFQAVIQDAAACGQIVKELKRRSWYLWEYGLISDTHYKHMMNSENPRLWQGFLFVGGGRNEVMNTIENIKNKFIISENCRFAYFPYDDTDSKNCIGNIKLDYASMKE